MHEWALTVSAGKQRLPEPQIPPPSSDEVTLPALLADLSDAAGAEAGADALDSAQTRMQRLVELLHHAVLHVVSVARAQRRDRLALVKNLLQAVDSVGARS